MCYVFMTVKGVGDKVASYSTDRRLVLCEDPGYKHFINRANILADVLQCLVTKHTELSIEDKFVGEIQITI